MKLNQIYNENCLDTMSRMSDGFIDLTVTSPPYDNLRSYNGFDFDFESIAKELFRVTKNGGVVVWVVGDATVNGSETGTSFRQALYFKEIGFNLHDTMIYETDKPPMNDKRYQSCFEFMFVISKGVPATFNPITRPSKRANERRMAITYRQQSGKLKEQWGKGFVKPFTVRESIWYFPAGASKGTLDACAFKHPATFPEALAKDHILSWSNENDLIYDPFGGSGTTAKAAHLLKRNWILSEISKEYCDIANRRLEPYLMQESLF